jgi:predicted dehydrogenase
VDIFVLGSDWKGHFDYLNAYCKVVYLDRTENVSSTMIRKEKFPMVRIGIVGTGRMAPRFMEEARYVSSVVVEAAYNPEKKSANAFQKTTQIPVYQKNMDAFFDRVDAVYIASPNETHGFYARAALEHGKHVLSELPLSFTHEETLELHRMAQDKQLVLMDAIKTAYCPGFQQMINIAKSGKIGEIKDIEACFTRLADPKSREYRDGNFGGAFLEFAGTTLLPIFKIYGMDFSDVQIDTITGDNGVDLFTKVQLRYPDAMATAKMGIGVKAEGDLVLAGTKGYILAPSPWWMTRRFDIRRENPSDIEHFEPSFQGDGLRYEISAFASKINGTGHKDYKLTEAESVAMSRIVEMFMQKRAGEKQQAMRKELQLYFDLGTNAMVYR